MYACSDSVMKYASNIPATFVLNLSHEIISPRSVILSVKYLHVKSLGFRVVSIPVSYFMRLISCIYYRITDILDCD